MATHLQTHCTLHTGYGLTHWKQSLDSYHANNTLVPHQIVFEESPEGFPVFYMSIHFPEEVAAPLNGNQEEFNLPRDFIYKFSLSFASPHWTLSYALIPIDSSLGDELSELVSWTATIESAMLQHTLDVSSGILHCADGTCTLIDNDCIANVFAHASLFGNNLAASTFKPHYDFRLTQDLQVWSRSENDLILFKDSILRLNGRMMEEHTHTCALQNDAHTLTAAHRIANNVGSAVEGWGRQASASKSGFGYPLGAYIRYFSRNAI